MTYLIRARLREDAGGSDGALIKLLAENAASPWKAHNLVWTLFGDSPERARDFVFRLDHEAGRPTVLAYAPRKPVPARADIWRMEATPFAPKLFPGERIRFTLRVNPVKQNRNVRVDAVYDAFFREREAAKAAGAREPDRLAVATRVGGEWLERRASRLGLRLEPGAVHATAYQAGPVRRLGKGCKDFNLAVLDLAGEAEVCDPVALTAALPAGIGKGKAYGCGMMLIARA